MRQRIPSIQDDQWLRNGDAQPLLVGSPDWFAWLDAEGTASFSYRMPRGSATVRRERKRNGWYWYAYRHQSGKLRKVYLGKSAELTAERLRDRVASLTADRNQTVRLRLFGPPVLHIGDTQVALTAKALALLAYLATREIAQSREQVIALLWPESTLAAGRKNLRNLLWSIGTTVDAALIDGNTRLTLHPGLVVDVCKFDQTWSALRALERESTPVERLIEGYTTLTDLPCGPLLEGMAFDDAPDLELWLSGERERFHQAHMFALRSLIEALRTAGRWCDMLAAARTALSYDHLQEAMHCALMEAHARLGERAQALRQYDTLRALLDRELSVLPLPGTELVREAILSGAFQPELQIPSLWRAAPRRLITTSYIGREAEFAALDERWAQVQHGVVQVVLLIGEAGIGKSRLWQTWAERIGANVRVLEAYCLETTRSLPFAPLLEPLRDALLSDGGAVLMNRTRTPTWLSDLSRLLPELHDRLPDLPLPAPLPPAEEQRRIFEALVQSAQIAPASPLILFVDDLQWADRATLDWLGYLVHRVHDAPLLVVGTYRPEELPAPIQQLISAWARRGLLQRLPLQRLNRDETATLITALQGDLARADALYTQSAGNPYFLHELIHAPPDHVPAALVDLISAQLDNLPEAARQVLQAAAVLQPYSDFAALWPTSGRSESETLDAIDTLVQRQLLVEQGSRLAFNHPLIAHAVDVGLSGMRRALLHRRAAEAWRASGHIDDLAGRLANHYQEAGDTVLAAHYAEQAGDQALALGAIVEAHQFYQMALNLEPTPARHYGVGLARYWQGDLHGAQDAFTAAHAGYIEANDGHGVGRTCLELARTALSAGQSAEVIRWVTLGRSYLADKEDPTASSMAAYLLGTGMRTSGQSLAQAEIHLQEALVYAKAADARVFLPGILFELGNLWAQRGDLQTALDYFKATISAAQHNNDILHIVLGYNNTAYHAMLFGDLITAHQYAESGLELIEERGMDLSRQWLYSTRGQIALATGEWDMAASWFARGIVEAEHYANSALIIGYRANFARVAWGRGDLFGALALLEAARNAAAALEDQHLLCQIELWLAKLYIALHKPTYSNFCLARADDILATCDYALLRNEAEQLRSPR